MWGRSRGWWRLPVIAVIAGIAAGLLYAGSGSAYVAAYGGFAASLVALALSWIAWVWRAKTSPAGLAAVGPDLDRVADLLAVAVKDQWKRAAGERGLAEPEPIPVTWGSPSLPLAGPAAAAAGSRRFAPLPGLASAGEAQLTAGQITDLHAVYGGLGSGRLVIAGAWGVGKSGGAVLLILAALEHREQVPAQERPKVPVPVLFTVQDWDPRRQLVGDWLTERLQETYPLFAGKAGEAKAAALIAGEKIAVILDGLDEIAEELRPVALQALSQQAGFRLVVLSRTDEMASAVAQRGMLQGAAAIELRPVDAATAADYLERVQRDPPPDGWRDLIGRIRASPESPLTNALNSPLTLTLVRDTYQAGDDARELLYFCDTKLQDVSRDKAAEEVTGHLLDRVLPAAYAHRPGQPPPRYDIWTAQSALTKIAAQMNQDHTRDLQWWRLPAWAPARPRAILSGLVAGLVAGFVVGPLAGIERGVAMGLVVGFLFGFFGYFEHGLVAGAPNRIEKPRMRQLLSQVNLEDAIPIILGGGISGGLVGGIVGGFRVGIVAGLGFGIVGGLVIGLVFGPGRAQDTNSPSPVTSWRNDRSYALVAGLVVGIVGGLGLGLMVERLFGLKLGLTMGLAAGLTIGLVPCFVPLSADSQVWPSALAAAQLAMRWHTPVRLMKFLDDARERNVLRTVGPVYQFRHARLQDRLADANDDSSDDSQKGVPI